ncbi:hypothetical protein JTB14_021596 [Gonioctena quinquepunctata]|nr:hypothetical protein JTB14_021596 [Gonioctena quinquepunctata]
MLTAAEFGVPFTESVLKDFMEQYINRKGAVVKQFRNNRPGSDWCYYFLLRNPELSKRNSQNIKRCRAELTTTVITEYFANLLEIVRGVPPANISNYDETNMTDDPGSQKIVVRRRAKHAPRILDSSKSSTSLMFAVLASGKLLTPYIPLRLDRRESSGCSLQPHKIWMV